MVQHLPEAIFRLIQTFLSCDDYHFLLNTSKLIFAEIKKRTVYFHLISERSFQYLTDIDFQRLLLSKVENGWEQIGIRYDIDRVEIPLELPIHKIVSYSSVLPTQNWNYYQIIRCRYNGNQSEIPQLLNVKEVHLLCDVETTIDLNCFSKVSVLHINNLNSPIDLTPLRSVPDLTIGSIHGTTDFSVLSSRRQLVIYNCGGLIDVTCFRCIHTLSLTNCPNISNVYPLNGVYCLKLHLCEGVRDISGLGNHHRLELSRLFNEVIGFDCLLHIPHVSLADFPIKDLSVLQYANSVNLYRCWNASDVSALKNVKKVFIRTKGLLTGLAELVEVPDLSLYLDSKQILNDNLISCLKNRRLTLSTDLLQISSLDVFSGRIEHLRVQCSETFADFINEGQGSVFTHLTSLTLMGMSLKSLEGLWNIPTVRLLSCSGFRSLQGLGGNRCVEIQTCRDLEDISNLATVPIVTIRYCTQLKKESYDCLKNVPRLKVVVL